MRHSYHVAIYRLRHIRQEEWYHVNDVYTNYKFTKDELRGVQLLYESMSATKHKIELVDNKSGDILCSVAY